MDICVQHRLCEIISNLTIVEENDSDVTADADVNMILKYSLLGKELNKTFILPIASAIADSMPVAATLTLQLLIQ